MTARFQGSMEKLPESSIIEFIVYSLVLQRLVLDHVVITIL